MIFVPLWTTFVYSVNAMLIWGGGYWAHEGAVDYSGGYVIHLAAGTSGFVAAWVIGPRLARDRQRFIPHSLPLVSIGAGIVWLGWNGFNGGDPYFASADAATAVDEHEHRHGLRAAGLGAVRHVPRASRRSRRSSAPSTA